MGKRSPRGPEPRPAAARGAGTCRDVAEKWPAGTEKTKVPPDGCSQHRLVFQGASLMLPSYLSVSQICHAAISLGEQKVVIHVSWIFPLNKISAAQLSPNEL